MPRWPARRKYDPLQRYLATLPAAEVTLTLGEVAAIVGAPLPRTARTRVWWANTSKTGQGRAWLSAGWRAARPQLRGEPPAGTFVRAPR